MSAAASRLLVVLPIAEQTACGFSPSSIRLVMMLHTSVIRSASRTDEPPNFITVFSTVEEPVAPAAAFGSSVAVIMILEGVRTAEGVRRRPEATERRERAISTAEEVPIAMQSGWNQPRPQVWELTLAQNLNAIFPVFMRLAWTHVASSSQAAWRSGQSRPLALRRAIRIDA